MSEIIFLGVLALIVIGPKELPELARTLGRFLNELKRTTNVLSDEIKQQAGLDKLNRLDYFEDRHKQNQPPIPSEDVPPMESEEDLYPLHKKSLPEDPEQLEFGDANETNPAKDPKKS